MTTKYEPTALDITRISDVALDIDRMLAEAGWTVRQPASDDDYGLVLASKGGTNIRLQIEARAALRSTRSDRKRSFRRTPPTSLPQGDIGYAL